jgi:hypothetical protein
MQPYKIYVFNEINQRATILRIDIPTRDSAPDGAAWVHSTAIAFTDTEMLTHGLRTVSPRSLGMRIRQQTKQIPRSLISEADEAQLITEAIVLLQREAKFWRNVEHTTATETPTIPTTPVIGNPTAA